MYRGAVPGSFPTDSDLVVSTGDAAFASDPDGRIVFWNTAAERLLGYRRDEALGRSCHALLCGVDPFGNRICTDNCMLLHMARRAEPTHRCELVLRRADGEMIHVDLSIVTVAGPRAGQWWMVHLLHPLTQAEEVAEFIGHLLHEPCAIQSAGPGANGNGTHLTPREVAVLRQLVEGAETDEVADRLGIRNTTVRSHIQSILCKLRVHNRAGAVAKALRDHLI